MNRILRKVTVGTRLAGGFAVLVVLMIVGVVLSLGTLSTMKSAQDDITEHAQLLLDAEEAKFHAATLNGSQYAYMLQAAGGDVTALDDTPRHPQTFATQP